MPESTGNRDEWRYYPEGPAPRSAAHAVRTDFMRIDFYDDFVGGFAERRTPIRSTGFVERPADDAGDFRQKTTFIDHLRRTSRFVDHQNIASGCINIDRMLTNGGSAWYVENVPRISKVLDGGLLGDGRYLIHDRRPSRLRSQYCLASAVHFRRANAKTPAFRAGVLGLGSLTITYFHT
ncbi:hypothetical protein, partial [Burkholderia cepacia]|uniref:hypothetical protein n=1 Tax=Burkholderia cepacia TaxID=292 RepID=UPI001E5F3F4C